MSSHTIPANPIHFKNLDVDGLRLFYREAGNVDAPVLLLLHGFPSSSHMFRNLIPLLAEHYHIIAPDLPGFGFSEHPDHHDMDYTFDKLSEIIERFTDLLGLTSYAIYVFDYGAPVGFRLALSRPERITAIITQNGNAYEVGLSRNWDDIQRYWHEPTLKHRNALRSLLTYEGTKWQYTCGVSDKTLLDPTAWELDFALLSRPGLDEIQLDLFEDYASNVRLYPTFHRYFNQYQPPLLAIWGEHDPFFLPEGAHSYQRDNPNAEIHLLNTGHFALETHVSEIAQRIDEFLQKVLSSNK